MIPGAPAPTEVLLGLECPKAPAMTSVVDVEVVEVRGVYGPPGRAVLSSLAMSESKHAPSESRCIECGATSCFPVMISGRREMLCEKCFREVLDEFGGHTPIQVRKPTGM